MESSSSHGGYGWQSIRSYASLRRRLVAKWHFSAYLRLDVVLWPSSHQYTTSRTYGSNFHCLRGNFRLWTWTHNPFLQALRARTWKSVWRTTWCKWRAAITESLMGFDKAALSICLELLCERQSTSLFCKLPSNCISYQSCLTCYLTNN